MNKKRILKISLVACFLFMSTGCMKYDATMDIKKDKSMSFNIIYALDKSILYELNKNKLGEGKNLIEDSDIKKLREQGYLVKKYEDGNMEGFELNIDIPNIDKVSSPNAKEYDLEGVAKNDKKNTKIFKLKKGLIKNKYIANFKFDSAKSNISEQIEGNSENVLPNNNSVSDNDEDTSNSTSGNSFSSASDFNGDWSSGEDSNIYGNDSSSSNSSSNATGERNYSGNVNEGATGGSTSPTSPMISDSSTAESSNSGIGESNSSGMSSNYKNYSLKKLTNEDETNNELDWSDLTNLISKSTSSLDLSFNVNLPYSAISNNATLVNNNKKELKWVLTSDKVNSIKFEFSLYNRNNIIILIVISIVLVVGIIGVLFKLRRNKVSSNKIVDKMEG